VAAEIPVKAGAVVEVAAVAEAAVRAEAVAPPQFRPVRAARRPERPRSFELG